MSASKGNELLQELYERLKGRWESEGKYKGQSFTVEDVKSLLRQIIMVCRKSASFKSRT